MATSRTGSSAKSPSADSAIGCTCSGSVQCSRCRATFRLPMPCKVQSYLASGRPIGAALDGEGAAVIEKSGAGLVCAAEDAAGLAGNVLALYRMSREAREAMGIKARVYYEANFERGRLLDQ